MEKEQSLMNIRIEGSFNYTCRDSFIEGYADLKHDIQTCYIDLSGTDIMDSSALGLLLTLKSDNHFKDAKVVLDVKGNETISSIIKMHNFHKLFEFYSDDDNG